MNVLVLLGKKQSGKTSLGNLVTGHVMKEKGVTKEYEVDDEGNLLVYSEYQTDDGQPMYGMGVLDLESNDPEFLNYSHNMIWPHVKVFSFAAYLKQLACELFGIDRKLCYGTNKEKNQKTELRWENMPGVITDSKLYDEILNLQYISDTLSTKDKDGNVVLPTEEEIKQFVEDNVGIYHKPGKMSVRNVLQYLGTNICRKMYSDCWVDLCIRDVLNTNTELVVITDARFRNEVEKCREILGAKVIRLARDIYKDENHISEKEVDEVPPRMIDYVLNNQTWTMKVKNRKVIEKLVEWGFVNTRLED